MSAPSPQIPPTDSATEGRPTGSKRRRALLGSVGLAVGLGLMAQTCGEPVQQPLAAFHQVDMGRYCPQSKRPAQRPELALAVAISGGGHRAGNFGMGALLGLEDKGLLQEVDYISTVSGGGWAAGGYVAALHDHLDAGGTHQDFSLQAVFDREGDHSLRRSMERGYKGEIASALLNPWVILTDVNRGDALEEAIDGWLLGQERRGRSLVLGDVFQAAGQCQPQAMVPYWITNSAVVTNGAIFPFTPAALERYSIHGAVHHMETLRFDDPYRAPVAVGVKASAAFPGGVPPTTLHSALTHDDQPLFIHLTDGGVVDNLGLDTALDMLEADTAKRKVLIVVDAFKDHSHPMSTATTPPSALSTAARTTTLAMDSDRLYARKRLSRMAKAMHIEVVYIDLDTLSQANPDSASVRARTAAARQISTDFNLTPEEQTTLVGLGKDAVTKVSTPLLDQLLVNP